MSFAWLAQFEWILIELLVLGILIWQLVSVRRAIRAASPPPKPPDQAPTRPGEAG